MSEIVEAFDKVLGVLAWLTEWTATDYNDCRPELNEAKAAVEALRKSSEPLVLTVEEPS